MKTVDLPERLAIVAGYIGSVKKDGVIPLNSMVWEGSNLVAAYNALAAERDELAQCLKGYLLVTTSGDVILLEHACKQARAALAKCNPSAPVEAK